MTVQPVVEAAGLDDPPANPAEGACWIVGPAPTGAWTGQAGVIAGWTGGGWRFVAPGEGFHVWNKAAARWEAHVGGQWESGVVKGARLLIDGLPVVGARSAAIAAPSGGTAIDAEARAAIVSVLAALRAHGLIAE